MLKNRKKLNKFTPLLKEIQIGETCIPIYDASQLLNYVYGIPVYAKVIDCEPSRVLRGYNTLILKQYIIV